MKPHKTSEGYILMEKRGARLFQQGDGSGETNWNIVELDSRRQLRQKVNELIRLSYDSTTTTSEMQQQLLQSVAMLQPTCYAACAFASKRRSTETPAYCLATDFTGR